MRTQLDHPSHPILQLKPALMHNADSRFSQEIIRRYDINGPRYTSYPTAPHFHESFPESALLAAIERSNQSAKPLSLYMHIPFCESLCYYCGCHKVVTANKNRSHFYLQQLVKEIALQSQHIDANREVKQLHWGGGTPTYISDTEMTQLMNATKAHFKLLNNDEGEYAIEIHPGKVSKSTMSHLRRLGFNRVSMGVQDFDETVQRAVNRFNQYEQVAELVAHLRNDRFHSISMDLIYGLPFQTLTSFSHTLERIIDLSPDRLSLFNYAHMPALFKSQQMIRTEDLPSPEEKLSILHFSINALVNAGYVHIGMDHFAKPNDALVVAQRAGKLQRNFQGYSTHGDCDLLAFGVSAISAIDNIYVQNEKNLNDYQRKLELGLLPYVKGFTLNDEDELRKFIINQLICHFELDFETVNQRFDIEMKEYFRAELQALQPMVDDGLIQIHDKRLSVSPAGKMLIRRICMVFDEYLNNRQYISYSKII